jgi:site-specific DNA-methyltransferase (adenine-specific)
MQKNDRMQKNLFGEFEPLSLTIEEAATKANVSTATIRNWIKTGYLSMISKGHVDLDGFNSFMMNVAGNEKLTQRANKLMKDEHDHIALSDFIKDYDGSRSWESLGHEYEGSLSNSYRNKEGIYYTPLDIIDNMLEGLSIQSDTTFLDPCCGSGNFIIQAIKKGVQPENVFGFDFDPNAVEITRKRILEETGFDASRNIQKLDFLEDAFKLQNGTKYNLIFTNPPWGRKIAKKEKERFAVLYGAGTSIDTTSLFYFASYNLIKKGGVLGFLVQDALFNIGTFQDTRKHILQNDLIRLIDYGKPFKGLLTKAYAFILRKKEQQNTLVDCEGSTSNHKRNQDSFAKNPKSILNFWASKEAAEVIEHIYSLPHITLSGKAKWGLGIVTGNNSKFCTSTQKEGYVPVFKGSDITPKGLKKPTNFIPNDFSMYQQVAPLELYQSDEKLIYKFISSKLVFYSDTEQRFILNSANFLVPSKCLNITSQQLADLLSSDFMNWLFTSIFNTHKILRGDIEQLPIHQGYFEGETSFDEKAFINFLGLSKSENGTYRIKR